MDVRWMASIVVVKLTTIATQMQIAILVPNILCRTCGNVIEVNRCVRLTMENGEDRNLALHVSVNVI